MTSLYGKSNQEITKFAQSDKGVDDALTFVSQANRLLLCISLAVLAVSLSFYVNMIFAMLAPGFLLLFSSFPETYAIMTEPLTEGVLILWISFTLLFYNLKKNSYLLLMVLLSAYAFLVRPAAIFMPFLTGLIVLFELFLVWRSRYTGRILISLVMGILLVASTAIWPVRLYMTSGLPVVSQQGYVTDVVWIANIVQPGDETLMPDERSRELVKKVLERKSEFDQDFFASKNAISKPRRLVESAQQTYMIPVFFKPFSEGLWRKLCPRPD